MKVQVDEIPPEGLTVELEVDGKGLFQKDKELDFEEQISARLKLHRLGESVTLSGETRADLLLQCSRCLEQFRYLLASDCSLEYRPLSEISEGGEVELSADEMDVQYYAEGAIDLDDVVMGQVAEGIPLKPLCSDGCLGLCIRCGTNLNEGSCGCITETIDPRLAKLKDLLDK